ncbi:uncharacterized protein LOC133307936 [Gastrolobium bilobum]|uniref:uncharacterized protein LOC133307936 n=1 Tax=Gastrolobium bilobum TaxID=150636 RepID=UPI002AB21813|nr:uncharacterized protein LOC133307936 [Gastrolobium bilobum]
MDAEHVLELLDSFWFETTILTNKTPSKFHHPTTLDTISQTKIEEVLPLDTKKLVLPNLEVRSYSDQNLGSTACVFCDSPSPDSVLSSPKLRTIPSEREVREFSVGNSENIKNKESYRHGRRRRRRLRKGNTSRSLTELEFKELKGFMDLGFVFSEEDKDSRLVSLIPGLQRLGIEGEVKGDEEEQRKIDETVISNKPYLSEAWDVLDQSEIRNPLLNWRIPARGDEIDMKHNLRFWAHTVASIVR